MSISIHSLVRGRTMKKQEAKNDRRYFNPLPRERENVFIKGHSTAKDVISIHSLVRGRTRRLTTKERSKSFQSTPSWEGEQEIFWILQNYGGIFQSTPSWEGEPRRGCITAEVICYFNPLPRERENCIRYGARLISLVFQSTPSWEGEPLRLRRSALWKLFQSTPSWEGERSECGKLLGDFLFQSTPSWEGELYAKYPCFKPQQFQSTPSWEGEPIARLFKL